MITLIEKNGLSDHMSLRDKELLQKLYEGERDNRNMVFLGYKDLLSEETREKLTEIILKVNTK